VKEIWVRSAQSMGADDKRLFRHVILPGALPYILTGLRLGLATGVAASCRPLRCWRRMPCEAMPAADLVNANQAHARIAVSRGQAQAGRM